MGSLLVLLRAITVATSKVAKKRPVLCHAMAEVEVDDADTGADANVFTRIVCIRDFEACGYLVRAGDGNMRRGLGHSL